MPQHDGVRGNGRRATEVLVALGYGTSLFASGLNPTSPITPAVANADFVSLASAPFQVGYLVPYFLVAVLLWRGRPLPTERLAAASLASVGAAAGLAAVSAASGGAPAAALAGSPLMGAGFAFLSLAWFSLLAVLPIASAAGCLLAGSLAAPLASLALGACGVDLGQCSPLAASLLTACLGGASAACLGAARRRLDAHDGPGADDEADRDRSGVPTGNAGRPMRPAARLKRLALPTVCAAMLVLVGPTVGFGAIDTSVNEAARSAVANLGLAGPVVVCAAFRRRLGRSPGIVSTYLVLFPLLATMLLLLAFSSAGFVWAFLAVSYFSYNMTSLLIILNVLEDPMPAGPERQAASLLAYSLMAGTVYLVSMLGAWFGHAVGAALSGSVALSALTFGSLYVMAIVAVAVSRLQGSRRGDAAPVADSAAKPEGPADLVEARCASVSGRYGLTERESQVLSYLAHGRDVPAIAERMCVSRETVKAHLKSIHRKLGVHSRQELLDLLESEAGQ